MGQQQMGGPRTAACRNPSRNLVGAGGDGDLAPERRGGDPGPAQPRVMHGFRGAPRRAQLGKRGVIAPLVAIAAPVLIGFAGFAVDVVQWQATKNGMQGAADRAALAAGTASQRTGGGSTAQITEARSVAASHGFVHGKDNVQVNLGAPTSGNFVTTAGALEVTISGPAQRHFTKLFLQTAPTVTGRAVVAPSNMCLLALGPTGRTISTKGGGIMGLTGCDIYNNSSDGSSTDHNGSGNITADNVNLVGGFSGNVNGNKVMGVRPALDPYADRMIPTRTTCDKTNYRAEAAVESFAPVAGSNKVFKFCRGLRTQGDGIMTFSEGTYIIDGGLDLQGGKWTLRGTNVTLVFTGNLNSGAIVGTNPNIELTAPSTGPYAGIGIWVDRAATGGKIDFGAGSKVSVTGAIYAPNAPVSLGGHAGSDCMQLVVRDVEMSGTSEIKLKHECTGRGISDVPGSFRLVE